MLWGGAGFVAAVAVAALALFSPAGFYRLVFENNLMAILPGAVYRSGQPSEADLERWNAELHLASVINLRGDSGNKPWFRAERAFAERHGIEHHTLRLNADRLPPRQALVKLIRLVDSAGSTSYPAGRRRRSADILSTPSRRTDAFFRLGPTKSRGEDSRRAPQASRQG